MVKEYLEKTRDEFLDTKCNLSCFSRKSLQREFENYTDA